MHPHGRGETSERRRVSTAHGTHQASAPTGGTGPQNEGLGELYIRASKELARRRHEKVSGSSDGGRGTSSQYVERMGVSAERGEKGREEKENN